MFKKAVHVQESISSIRIQARKKLCAYYESAQMNVAFELQSESNPVVGTYQVPERIENFKQRLSRRYLNPKRNIIRSSNYDTRINT